MNRVRLEKMTFLQLINDDICPFGKTVFFPEEAILLCLQSREARNHKAGEWMLFPGSPPMLFCMDGINTETNCNGVK